MGSTSCVFEAKTRSACHQLVQPVLKHGPTGKMQNKWKCGAHGKLLNGEFTDPLSTSSENVSAVSCLSLQSKIDICAHF